MHTQILYTKTELIQRPSAFSWKNTIRREKISVRVLYNDTLYDTFF